MEPVPSDSIAAGEFDLAKVDALPIFDPAEHLNTKEMVAAFVNDFLQEGNPAMIAHALGIAARAKGIAEVAKESGNAREDLYKTLLQENTPRFETILLAVKALGLRLVAEPIQEPASMQAE